jgi:hypothetical protein
MPPKPIQRHSVLALSRNTSLSVDTPAERYTDNFL